jgi:hypothetical protein
MSKAGTLPSAGITRFHRYYDPLRSPRQPSLPLTRCRLVPIFRFHCWGFPCSVCFPVHACRHQYPDRSNGPIRSYYSVSFGLPRYFGGSAPVLTVSGPAQCLLTLQPAYSRGRLNGPLHRRLRRFCCLHRRFDCYWVERTSSQVGLSPTEKHRLVTAHEVFLFTNKAVRI